MDKRSSKTILKIYCGFSACLAQKPFRTVNARDIIKAGNISPTGFYSHFRTKNDVLQGLLAKLFLRVKIRGEFNLEEYLSLLFFRIQNDIDIWKGVVKLDENAAFLRYSLLPWCKSFLPEQEDRTRIKLSCELLSAGILQFMRCQEENTPKKMATMLSESLSHLLELDLEPASK